MVGERGPERLKLTADEMKALMAAHMGKVTDGREAGNPFAGIAPEIKLRRKTLFERAVDKANSLLGRGN